MMFIVSWQFIHYHEMQYAKPQPNKERSNCLKNATLSEVLYRFDIVFLHVSNYQYNETINLMPSFA